MKQNPESAEPIQLSGDRLYVFEDIAIDLTGLPPDAFSNEPNQVETESFGPVHSGSSSGMFPAAGEPAPTKSV